MLSHIIFFYFVLIYHCLHRVALLSLFYVCVLLVIYYCSCLVDFSFAQLIWCTFYCFPIGLCGVIVLFFYSILLSFNLLGVVQFIKTL
jgi:hypothetical protein